MRKKSLKEFITTYIAHQAKHVSQQTYGKKYSAFQYRHLIVTILKFESNDMKKYLINKMICLQKLLYILIIICINL